MFSDLKLICLVIAGWPGASKWEIELECKRTYNMELIKQSVEIWSVIKNAEDLIEHECVENEPSVNATLLFITNRCVIQELVRHGMVLYSHESNRCADFKGKMQFIQPVSWEKQSEEVQDIFMQACKYDESVYVKLLLCGWTAERARDVLPNALKTELVVTYDMSKWRHVLELCTDKVAHLQTRDLMFLALGKLKEKVPVIFEDL